MRHSPNTPPVPTLIMIGRVATIEDDAIVIEVLGRHRRLTIPDQIRDFVRRTAAPGRRVLVRTAMGTVLSFLPFPDSYGQ